MAMETAFNCSNRQYNCLHHSSTLQSPFFHVALLSPSHSLRIAAPLICCFPGLLTTTRLRRYSQSNHKMEFHTIIVTSRMNRVLAVSWPGAAATGVPNIRQNYRSCLWYSIAFQGRRRNRRSLLSPLRCSFSSNGTVPSKEERLQWFRNRLSLLPVICIIQ